MPDGANTPVSHAHISAIQGVSPGLAGETRAGQVAEDMYAARM
jgi:hypothetical protein